MSHKLNVSKLIEFYQDQLLNSMLPFWLKNAIDFEGGGYYTCFDNSGRILLSQDKYTWS